MRFFLLVLRCAFWEVVSHDLEQEAACCMLFIVVSLTTLPTS